MASDRAVSVGGVVVHPGLLDAAGQRALVEALRGVVAAAPLFSPETRFGRKMSVRMTSAGQFGWMSDRRGYRYSRTHPETGHPWPPIPETALAVWRQVAATARPPECCLINFYTGSARMGLHQDRDEADFSQPVVSISLGDEALFRVGGTERGGPTESIWLRSGDVAVLAGPARLAHHGIDRIAPGSSMLLPQGGRINLTMRVVT
jgi:alkylated DNA repair protein (DNA oxidative demethylase)